MPDERQIRDKLVDERDMTNRTTGKKVCVSCHQWNCWHVRGKPCDVYGCQCELGMRCLVCEEDH